MSESEAPLSTPHGDSNKSQNANLWNELGNLYFKTGAYDSAIAAYSKAIEHNHYDGWSYSNLALTYVQMGRFSEAIMLYQRSIELFKLDSEKAITWNRLGNVYRRINDYENAFVSYQTADKLDPESAANSSHSGLDLIEKTSGNDLNTELNVSIKDHNKIANVLPLNSSQKEMVKATSKTETFLQETVSSFRIFFKWTISSIADGIFVALWALIQYSFNKVIQNFPLEGIDIWVFRCFQFLFALTTIAPVVIYIYEDIMTMGYRTAKRVRLEKERTHILE